MMKIRTVILGMAVVFSMGLTQGAWAQNLDLGALAAFDFVGKDASDNRTACHLNVSEIGRDFSGRYFQDFRAWVNGRADLNFTIRLKGADRYRAPNAITGSNAEFDVPMDVYVVVLIGNVADPTQINEFRLMDGSGVSSAPIIRCVGVKPVPR